MRSSRQEATGSAGAHRVMADFEDLGWGPVENNQHDLGIDLFLQVRDERRFDRTVLMTAQVKTGPSYFESPEHDETGTVVGWWYTESDAQRFEDWVQHGLPHLMVLHDLETRMSYWAHVSRDSVQAAGEGFKVLVPADRRVERAQLPALLEVAASGKAAWSLEGTAWTAGAKAVAPGRALRHALVAPRLIALHPNAGHSRVLEPEEAIALVSQGRAADLARYRKSTPALNRLEQQKGWRWRFLRAYFKAVQSGDIAELLELAGADDSKQRGHAYRRAAVAVACAVFLVDAERWDDAERALEEAGGDLAPVDHAWVVLHRALLAGERGDIGPARSLAAESQRAVELDADDVTARAIAAAAAAFLFESSRWEMRELEETLTAGDTASSWWRSQSVAWALAEHDKTAFLSWGAEEEAGSRPVDWAEEWLQGVWLQASFGGARRSVAGPLAQHACHAVMHHEARWRGHSATAGPETGVPELADAVDILRRHGHSKELAAAIRRLWAAGPVESVARTLERSLQAPWRHTTARTKLLMWELAGDLLPAAQADEAAAECLRILDDPQLFEQRVRPTFVSDYYASRALRRVLSAASDAMHTAAISHILQRLDGADGRIEDLAHLVLGLRPSVLASGGRQERWRRVAVDHDHRGLSAAMLGRLAGAGDIEAQDILVHRVQEGDVEAFDFVPWARLAEAGSSRLAGMAADQCRAQVQSAQRNAWDLGGVDWGWLLTWCGLSHPEHADWPTVLDLITQPKVANNQKLGTLRLLAWRADELPDDVADQLRRSVAVQPDRLCGVATFGPAENLPEAALGLGFALGVVDTLSAIAEVAARLRGNPAQRKSAARLLAQVGVRSADPSAQGLLLALASDPHPGVRGEAAAALTRSLDLAPDAVCRAAVLTAAREDGCRTPLAVARSLPETGVGTELREQLVSFLARHASALVRNALGPAQPGAPDT
ncbi:DUF4365 domain-containing protein [Streptomyces sp. enrichment culture]|uniref:DUF4365 domain-containing protein n=1 Tax=Streptomyces sp. enrichment culture TaxID=1795815 RepID=UPI003F579181